MKKATVMAHHRPHVVKLREQLGVAGLLDSLLLTRAFEMCEIGQELLALALLGGLGTLVPTAWVAASTVAICACSQI